MFIRLNSDYFARRHLITKNQYTVSQDKSGVQIKCDIEDGNLTVGPVAMNVHAAMLMRNPALGKRPPEIITPDSGKVDLDGKLTTKQAETAADLDWHYRIYFMRIDTPYYPS